MVHRELDNRENSKIIEKVWQARMLLAQNCSELYAKTFTAENTAKVAQVTIIRIEPLEFLKSGKMESVTTAATRQRVASRESIGATYSITSAMLQSEE